PIWPPRRSPRPPRRRPRLPERLLRAATPDARSPAAAARPAARSAPWWWLRRRAGPPPAAPASAAPPRKPAPGARRTERSAISPAAPAYPRRSKPPRPAAASWLRHPSHQAVRQRPGQHLARHFPAGDVVGAGFDFRFETSDQVRPHVGRFGDGFERRLHFPALPGQLYLVRTPQRTGAARFVHGPRPQLRRVELGRLLDLSIGDLHCRRHPDYVLITTSAHGPAGLSANLWRPCGLPRLQPFRGPHAHRQAQHV